MSRPKNFPPGPWGIPIIGSAHYLTKYSHLGMVELSKKYGNVFSLKVVQKNMVCIVGYEAVKNALATKNFNGRRLLYVTKIARGNPKSLDDVGGIILAQCTPSWAANRRLFHSTINEIGLGKAGIEETISRELDYLIESLESSSKIGEAFDMAPIIEIAILNILASFIFGCRYDGKNKKMARLIELNKLAFSLTSQGTDPLFFLPQILPGLEKFWISKSAMSFIDSVQKIVEFCEEEVNEHKKTLDSKCPRDFIDCYLIKMESQQSIENKNVYNKKELLFTLADLFQAGAETTATALEWAMLFLAGHPDIQQKVFAEITEVLGTEKQASYEERKHLPYTEAMMYEVLRFGNIASNGVPRMCVKDTIFEGYFIPKGTSIMTNYYSAHFQKDKWKNPDNFDPENFLDENGKFYLNEAFMGFGGGNRICLGMALAKQELFVFLVGIVQRFKILPEKEISDLDYFPRPGLLMRPKPHKFRLLKRV